ncbi:MAG TPA: vWA domain-containing protein [Nannocystis sp.]|jgi:hypothetical protein
MHPPASLASWTRGALQLGLLLGVGLAFVGAGPAPLAAAPMPCQHETPCTFKKPLLLFVVEYSGAMNQPHDADSTRWQAAVETIGDTIDFDNGYIAEAFILGLLRYGHDPAPAVANTPIVGDTTGLLDGHALDVPWYDPADPDKAYVECIAGDAIVAALADLPAPADGIAGWTRGALDFTQTYLAQVDADHPEDEGQRRATIVLITTGTWTDPTGTMQLGPPEQDPELTAATLYDEQKVATHVINVGGPMGALLSAPVAAAGGGEVFAAEDFVGVSDALKLFIDDIQNDVPAPVCTPAVPRVMVLLDASSSMLNVGDMQAGPGQGAWDQARDALAGDDSVFDIFFDAASVESAYHAGLAVFGGAAPAEQQILVQYGPCHKDMFAWALDPASSCVAPGCTDPYAGPPITWTFKNGADAMPPFPDDVFSHMPRCDKSDAKPQACAGSGSYVHLGLELVADNIEAYRAQCLAPNAAHPCDDTTPFFNVLITDGAYDSTDAQVQAPLVAMAAAGVVTRVIGLGPASDLAQLEAMADWGSGSVLDPILADSQSQLADALASLFVQPTLGPCCSFTDCNFPDDSFGEDDDGGDGSLDGSDTEVDDTGATGPVTTTAPDDTSTTGAPETTSATTDLTTSPTTAEPDPTATPTTGPPDPSNLTNTTPGADSDVLPPVGSPDDGCGCDTRGRGPAHLLVLVALAGLRRRRATAR